MLFLSDVTVHDLDPVSRCCIGEPELNGLSLVNKTNLSCSQRSLTTLKAEHSCN